MNQIPINTSQNVNIMFNLASVGERIFAFVLDMMIKIAYSITFFYFFADFIDGVTSELEDWMRIVFILIILFPVWFYTIGCELLMEGQTFGKKLMKIKVVKIDGYQASFGDYLIRWIFQLIDTYATSGVVALLCIIFSENNQRIGGMVSGTAVISLKNKVNITHTILENLKEDYQPTFPQVVAFSDNDMRIIKENFKKADIQNDKEVLQKLVMKIEEILGVRYDETQFTPRKFINTMIQDYNFYTGKDN